MELSQAFQPIEKQKQVINWSDRDSHFGENLNMPTENNCIKRRPYRVEPKLKFPQMLHTHSKLICMGKRPKYKPSQQD